MLPPRLIRRLKKAAMTVARESLTKAERIYRDFMTLPPETRILFAQEYLNELIQALLEEKKPKPANRYEKLMSDDDDLGVDP